MTKTDSKIMLILVAEIKESGDFEELSKFPLCRKCQEIPSEPIVTDCLHLYCANCLIHMASGDRTICIPCQKPFAKSERYSPSHKVINKISPDEDFWGDEAKNKIPRKAAADNMKWAVLNNKVLASTKAKAAVTQIKEWLAQFPKTKLVVFRCLSPFISSESLLIVTVGSIYCTSCFSILAYHRLRVL